MHVRILTYATPVKGISHEGRQATLPVVVEWSLGSSGLSFSRLENLESELKWQGTLGGGK